MSDGILFISIVYPVLAACISIGGLFYCRTPGVFIFAQLLFLIMQIFMIPLMCSCY